MSTPMKIDAETLVASLQDGVVVCSKAGEILYANHHFARMVGVLKDQIMAKNMGKDLVDRELEWRALVSLLEQGSPIADYEMRFRRADGVKLCITISATNLRDEKGALIGLGIVARDISTRKGVEDELRDKAFRTDIMNKVAKLTGTTTDVKHVLLPVSEELRKLINFDLLCISVTEEKGRHVEVLVPDRKNPESARAMGKVPFEGSLVEKLKYGRNALIIERDAGRKLFSELALLEQDNISSLVAVPLMSRGRVLGSLSITHSKQGEYNWESAEALQMVADQLAGLVDNMILMGSLEKKVKLSEMLVKSGVELQKAITTQQVYQAISTHMGEVVPYKDLSFYLVDWQKGLVFPVHAVGTFTDEVLAAPGGIDEGIVGIVAKSGKAEFVDDVDADPRGVDVPGIPYEHDAMLAIPLVGSDGVLGVLELYRGRGMVFTNSDLEAGTLFAQQAAVALSTFQLITKLQDAKKEIEMLNDLMFHDINNYNFATLNYIENIWKAPDVAANHKVFLEKSLHLIRQNAKLIENVRKLTKIGVVRPEDLVPVDLTDVLRKVSAGIQTSTPDKRVSIRLNMPDSGHAVVHANPLVEELFVNLLGNAVKYDPHEEVEVDVEGAKVLEDGKICWKICVSDHGNGIPDDKKAKLFQKYVRLKPDSKIAGTGLGLSICKALADKFGGRIWVEDRVAGKSELGAKFCVVFPAVKKEEKA